MIRWFVRLWRRPIDRGRINMETWLPTKGTRYTNEGVRY